MVEKPYVTQLFRLSSKNQTNFKIDLIRRKTNYYASKPSINYQQMAGAALHKEINAMWSSVILPGCKNSLFTVIFLDASSHLYKRVCPSVGPSVRRSVRPSVGNQLFSNSEN